MDSATGTGPAAIILGLGEHGYGILRGLVREGISVAGFYTGAEEFGRYSRHVETHHLPSFLDDERICRALIEWGRQAGTRPVLFPTSDRHVALLARHTRALSEYFRFHWVDSEVLGRIVDQARMSAVCRGAGVLAPRTYAVSAEESLPDLATRLPYPCVVKPNRACGAPFPERRNSFVAASPAELLDFYEAHPALRGSTICQEIIEGGDENIFQCTVLVRDGGEPGAVFSARKLHQHRPGYGVMCFGRSEENEMLAAQALRLLQSLRYRGLASLEFKYRARNGRYYFIEMDARLPRYNALCVDAGVNLPHLAYLDLTGQRPAAASGARQRNGVHWISFKLDLGWFVRSWIAGRAGLLSWLRSIARARSYAWFDWRDPLPFLRATADLLARGCRQSLRLLFDKGPSLP